MFETSRRRLLASITVLALSAGPFVASATAQVGAGTSDTRDGDGDAVGDRRDDVVVTAAGYEQAIVKAPASITVLDRAELEDKRFGSLAEALQDVQGVDVGGEAGKTGGLNISIRGMPSDYTLVLIDGRRQNAPGGVTPNGFGETATSFLPPYSAIDRIEVVRGPMSTLYGSDAMGGVVNIITRKVGDDWVGTATGESTIQGDDRFGNIQSINGFAQGPVVRELVGLSLRGSVFHREASDIAIPGDPALTLGRNPVRADTYSYGGRVTLTPHADHDLWFEYDRNEQTYDNSEGRLGTLGSGGYAPRQRFNRSNYVLAHSWRLGAFGSVETTLTRNETETIGRLIPNGTPGRVPGSPRTLQARNDIVDSRLAGRTGAVAFTVGGQYWKARMVEGVAPEPFGFTQWAGFAEATLTVTEGVNLTGGVRYDDHSTFGSKWSPRAYAVWNIDDALTLKGGVSRGFKTPRVEQIAEGIIGFGGQGRIPLLGTPGLTPETSTTYEAGLYYDRGAINANVTLFNNDFDDKIASGPGIPNCRFSGNPNRPNCLDVGPFPTVDLFGQSINIDRARTRGVEAAGRVTLARGVTLAANYTYTETEQLSGVDRGLPLIGIPRHMVNGNLRWRLDDRASLWARAEIRSGRYRGNNAQQAAVGDFRGYELFHLGGSYQVAPALRLGAAVYNVFDSDYALYVPYRSGAATVFTPAYSINQEGRRLLLSANVDF